MYSCLFNHELLILGTTQTPYQRYTDEIGDDQVRGYVRELAGTGVDALMCCPTAWRRNLWPSRVDPHWTDEAPQMHEPLPGSDLKYYEKAYYRLRRYMLSGKDPVAITCEEAKAQGLAFFISYRMNDHHHLADAACPTHNTAFLRLRDAQFKPGREGPPPDGQTGYLDYRDERVRAYYTDILTELSQSYDIDGLELDFMRSPAYFPDGTAGEGEPLMTAFVGNIRALLDRLGKERGKTLRLCVRVPARYEACLKTGLRVEEWASRGWIDMVNISSYYINDLALDVQGYRAAAPSASLYGEMHFIADHGRMGAFTNNVTRKTSREMYWAMADTYLSKGADGVSLFNFDYVRDHHFGEPRREGDFGREPPLEWIKDLTDRQGLRTRPKHYYFRAQHARRDGDAWTVTLDLPRDAATDGHARAILRVVLEDACQWQQPQAFIDGRALARTQWLGELFPPLTPEALPAYGQLRFFEVPPALLAKGRHTIRLEQGGRRGALFALDVALYRPEITALCGR